MKGKVMNTKTGMLMALILGLGCSHASPTTGQPGVQATIAGPEISTTQGILVVTGVQVTTAFPPGCTSTPCLKPGSGRQMLILWLAPKVGGNLEAISSWIQKTFSSVTLSAKSGTTTQGTAAGLAAHRLFMLFVPVSRNNSMRSSWRLRFCQCLQERYLTGIRVVSVAPSEIRAARLQSCGSDAGSAMVMATGRERAH
jgi:hypothetical protein